MTGTITKYRYKKRKKGRSSVSYGYYFKAAGQQFTKSGFPSKEAAQEALRSAIAAKADTVACTPAPPGEETPRADTRTLADYLAYWLDEHAALRCQETTMEDYRKLAKYLVRHLGHTRICDLRPAPIQEMVNRLQRHGGAKTKKHPKGRPLSAKRTHAIASMLYTCLADAVRLDHLLVHPMANRKVKLPKRVKREPPVLDEPMLGKLYAQARGKREYPYIITAASSGARRGELCALTWEDVDFDNSRLSVSKSLSQTRAHGLRVKSTKSGKPRYFPLDDFALEVLAEHREEQARDKAKFRRDYQDLGLVFCRPNGYYYSPDAIGSRVKELMVEAGLGDFSLHSLRHSHATIQLSKGTPLEVVSKRLGHANSNITLGIYSHALPADVRAAAKAWHNALADVIAEERKHKQDKGTTLSVVGRGAQDAQNLGKSRKLAGK
jgi:integrase